MLGGLRTSFSLFKFAAKLHVIKYNIIKGIDAIDMTMTAAGSKEVIEADPDTILIARAGTIGSSKFLQLCYVL